MILAYGKFLELTFDFTGKTTRKDYWLASLVNFIIVLLFAAGIDGFARILTEVALPHILDIIFAFAAMIWIMFALLFIIGTILPNVSMSFRRYRDAGVSKWLFIVEAAFLISLLVFVSQWALNGYTTILATLIMVMLLLADVLIKLLPSEREEVAAPQELKS
ncbi:DUF805 domain-containing protein [Fructobacillus sp. M2-14]|uniref:DUF805 domain-containing protein n=1 Tax=Fructobacillus broussonetiae TaxID=2713173 RepID=A0ABS5QZL1_9LACO|nr:DUF805 domain-containing protein [Fructobacillus broussonetiae]MBS9338546.1 DUF805 domain-containing protein [Fructobacillus broussonetiae]